MSETSAPRSAERLTDTRPQPAVSSGPAGSDRDFRMSKWLPWLVAAALAVFYATVSIRRHLELLTSAYDLGIYDQAVRSYSQWHLPFNTIQGPHFDVLGDHFSPVLALLAPLYWIHDSPTTLLAAQGALIAIGVVPLMKWAMRSVGLGAGLVVGIRLRHELRRGQRRHLRLPRGGVRRTPDGLRRRRVRRGPVDPVGAVGRAIGAGQGGPGADRRRARTTGGLARSAAAGPADSGWRRAGLRTRGARHHPGVSVRPATTTTHRSSALPSSTRRRSC